LVFKTPDYLVDGLFKRGFFYSITAMTGAGKTAVALLLSVAVADPNENAPIEMLNHARTQRKLTELPGRPCVIALNHPIKNVTSPDQLKPRGGGGYLNETDGNFTLWAHDDKLSDFYYTAKLRGPDFEKITFRMAQITTTKLTDAKGRLMPTVMAQIVTDADIAEVENKSTFQENRLLEKKCAPGRLPRSPNWRRTAAG
jgi:hypothetical protein